MSFPVVLGEKQYSENSFQRGPHCLTAWMLLVGERSHRAEEQRTREKSLGFRLVSCKSPEETESCLIALSSMPASLTQAVSPVMAHLALLQLR